VSVRTCEAWESAESDYLLGLKHQSPDSQSGPLGFNTGRCLSNTKKHNSATVIVKRFHIRRVTGGE